MGLFKRKKRQLVAKAEDAYESVKAAVTDDGHDLPGSAGYRGTTRLPKGAMPISRFTYKRPDGKE